MQLGGSTFGACNLWPQMCAPDITAMLCSLLNLSQFQSMTEQLPPNSLVFRLSTTGKLYLVPLNDPSTERPPIPEHQNLSDGEIDTLRPTRANRRTPHIMKPTVVEQETKLKSLRETKMKHGAPLAAILKCVICFVSYCIVDLTDPQTYWHQTVSRHGAQFTWSLGR